MTRQLACTTNNSRSYSKSRISRKKNVRARFKRFINGVVDILSAIAAWFYAACYTAFWLVVCALILAVTVVAWDTLIICGDPASSWGAGNAYEIFWFCLNFIKWSAIIAISVIAFFGGTRILGVVFKDAYAGAYEAEEPRANLYKALAIAFFLPTVVVNAVLENAEEYFGTLQLVDLIIERI